MMLQTRVLYLAQITEKCVAFARGDYKGLSAERLESSVIGTRKRQDLLLVVNA